MKLGKKALNRKLSELQSISARVCDLSDEIDEHCKSVYGHSPSDIDNDEYIDACTMASGKPSGDFDAGDLDRTMRESLEISGIS